MSKLRRVGADMSKKAALLKRQCDAFRRRPGPRDSRDKIGEVDINAVEDLLEYYEVTQDAAKRWIKMRDLVDNSMFCFTVD